MSTRWISLGEILVEPDGSNLRPVAAYPVIDRSVAIDENGRPVHTVIFERQKSVEQRFLSTGNVPYLKRVQVPEQVTVTTDNSATARWFLTDDSVLVERKPVGDSYLDRIGNDEDLYDLGGSQERRVAQEAALGAITRSVIEDFRPIVDDAGNFIVAPFPVLVAKHD